MTIVRDILLTVLAFAPLTAWGQVFTPSQPGMIDGGVNATLTRARNGAIIDPRFTNGAVPGLISDQNAASMPQTAFDSAFQVPPETISQQQLPQGLMPGVARHYSSPIWQTTVKGGYFGIMGAIAQPGVYFHKNERITLGELLKLAGGSTSPASGGVRIVRQGRGGLQTFLAPDSPHEIMNGDVILLESHGSYGKSGLREYPKLPGKGDIAGKNAVDPKAAASTYLAFVNLMPQPIIVPVPSDQATLVSVVKWLRQDADNPPFVRVLAPSPVVRQNSSRPPEQQLLENGTVVVFDPALVKRDRLPAFPPVIGQTSVPEAVPVSDAPGGSPLQSPVGIDPARIPSTTPPPQQLPPEHRVPVVKPARVPTPPMTHRNGRAVNGQHVGQTPQSFPPVDYTNDVPVQAGPQTGGPVLMMPQTNRPPRSQATAPESNSRQNLPTQRIESPQEDTATPANYEGQPMSWQSRPPVRANVGMPDVDDQGVVQAHGEHGHVDDEFAGPSLELPKPVPQLLHADSAVSSQPVKATALPAVGSTFSSRIVWFSLGSMVLLVAALWCLARWDGPRPVRAAISAGHTSRFRVNANSSSTAPGPQVGLHFIKRTDKTLAEAPLPVAPVAPAVPTPPVRATPAAPAVAAPAPGPTRIISQEEKDLVAAFREARKTRESEVPTAVAAPLPAPQISPLPTTPRPTISEQQQRIAERVAASKARILAQVPNLPKATQPTSSPASAPSGNLLDRVLRAQQKR